jgi:hypothetical protein
MNIWAEAKPIAAVAVPMRGWRNRLIAGVYLVTIVTAMIGWSAAVGWAAIRVATWTLLG